MRITNLEYKRTANLGDYENCSLAATSQVADGEEPAEAMQELRDWVERQVAQAADLALERRVYDRERLQGQLRHIEAKIHQEGPG